MTRQIFFSLLLYPLVVFADLDEIFPEGEDPAIFHHVNVITGNLNLSFQDALVLGAKPIPIIRTYSSSGALERLPRNSDLILQALRGGWIVQGGWSLFPHENMLVETYYDTKAFKVYLPEPNGSLISYAYSHKQKGEKHTIFLKPTHAVSQASGKLSFRTNPQNNLLRIDLKKGIAVLFLSNGGTRTYRGPTQDELKDATIKHHFYVLEEERLPSGHHFCYLHGKNTRRLERIESKNPAGSKVYAAIDIESMPQKKRQPFKIKYTASDGKRIEYSAILHEDRSYLSGMQSNCAPKE